MTISSSTGDTKDSLLAVSLLRLKKGKVAVILCLRDATSASSLEVCGRDRLPMPYALLTDTERDKSGYLPPQ